MGLYTGATEGDAEGRPAWPDMWGADAKGAYIVGGRCSNCRGLALGVREVCPHCFQLGAMREERIGRRGTLYTATMVQQVPRGFDAPYRIGYVDLEEGVRIFAHIDHHEAAPRIGDDVELTIGHVRNADGGGGLTGPIYHLPRKVAQ